jgi:hypothetical protein
MFTQRSVRSLVAVCALGVAPMLAYGLVSAEASAAPHQAVTRLAASAAPAPALTQSVLLAKAMAAARAVTAIKGPAKRPGHWPEPTEVDNPRFPLVPGTEFVYRGKIVEGGDSTPHSVVFTVTDLTKVVDGVRTVVAWDRDFLEGRLEEQELAFFAQDSHGNVWNFGEYPEEYVNGKFTGAPSTWIRGAGGAYGGIHMLARPKVGAQYLEGLVPAIEFNDVSKVISTSQRTCVRTSCYRHVLVVDEWSPNDPASGHQIKYYARHVGLVRVGARGGDSQEFLTLAAVRHLGRSAISKVRAEVLKIDRRAYRVSRVYRVTRPAERRPR